MHYINWHIEEYASHTAHLTPLEDIAYRRMLDSYYLHEKPLPRDVKAIAREIRMREHEAEVRAVLAEFFVRSPRGYTNKRADEEIQHYRNKVEAATNAGRASAARRRNGRSTTVEPTSNEKGTDAQPSVPVLVPVPPLPLPSEGRGGVDPDPDPEPRDPVVELQQALLRRGLRPRLPAFSRGRELMELAKRAHPSGITPADIDEVWPYAVHEATKRDDGDPAGLLDHWLEHGILLEVRDRERNRTKEGDAARRASTAAAADPLAGVYGA